MVTISSNDWWENIQLTFSACFAGFELAFICSQYAQWTWRCFLKHWEKVCRYQWEKFCNSWDYTRFFLYNQKTNPGGSVDVANTVSPRTWHNNFARLSAIRIVRIFRMALLGMYYFLEVWDFASMLLYLEKHQKQRFLNGDVLKAALDCLNLYI